MEHSVDSFCKLAAVRFVDATRITSTELAVAIPTLLV